MANNQYRLFQSSRVLTKGILAALVLGLFVLTASAMADIVERYNAGGTLTGSGTDVAAVQNADGLAENDVIIISGTATHNTGIAQTIQNFTIRSSQAGVKQTIKAGNTRLYNFNDGVKTYNINLKDLDYQGYSSAVGNAIGLFMHTSPNLTLNINTDNVSFTGFKNAGYHGGVFGLDGAGNLNIVATNGLVFDGNRTNASTGGAIHVNNGTLSIKADTLTFKNSYAATIGGAIYAGNKVTIEADSMTFESNSAGGGQGGAIYSKHDTLISGNTILFKSNSSTAHAGAIRLDNSSATLTIKGNSVTFDNNNGAGNEGGAICAHKLVMNGTSASSVTTFKNNKTKNFGGAICAYTEATFKTGSFYFDNNSFSTRYTTNGYGGGAMTTNKLTISDVNVLSFTKNNSAYNGGAINLTASGVANIEAKTIIFEDNVANDHGGAIHGQTDALVSITGESISFARNSNKTGDGGAIRMANSTVNVSGKNADTVITFSNNVSKGLGGAISARANLSNGAFTFENNSAGTYGGAIHGGIVAFSGDGTSAVFTGNTAVSGGNDLNVSVSLSFTDDGTYSFDGGIRLANDDTTMTIDKAQVTVSGRANDATNIYQLKNTTITNGGKLTANLDNINSFTGAFNLGYTGTTGTLELNLGAGLAREFSLTDVSFSGDGTLVKSGTGTVTFTGENPYFGEAKVSGGTLVVPSSTTFGAYKVTVETGATFKTGADMPSAEFVLDGGSFVVGDTSTSSEITIGSISLDGGRICFDFNTSGGEDADWLMVTSSATLNSGYIDLSFHGSSSDDWWDFIHTDYSAGFSIIQGNIVDYDQFNPEDVKVTINGQPTNSWELGAQSGQLLLYAVEGEDPTVDPWYDANTSDTSLPNWTITGTDRVGAKFTDGGSDAEYSKEVIMNGNGQFDVNSGRNLTLSNTVSGDGAVTKIGEGTLTLAANNTYAGGTTISEGKLVLNGNGTLGTGGVVNNTVLEFAHDSAVTIGNVISGTGSVAMTGAGTVTLSGDNSYSGGTTISAGTLAITSATGLGTGPVTINGGTLDTTAAGSGQTFNYELTIGANGGTITAAGSSYSTFKSVSGSGDLTTNGYVLFNGGGGYNGHVTVKSGYMCIKPDSFGVFDLTLDGGQVNVAEAGTIHIGKLNAPNGGSYLFGSNENNQYVFEIGVGTTSTDVATYGSAIRGNNNGAYNVTIKKVGEGTQIFNRTGYAYSGTPNSIKEVIVDGGKMIIDANNTDAFKASNTNGFWGTAPITVNSGGTLEFKRSWTTAPNVQMTINGGTLTLSAGQYLNKVTLNSGTVDGSNDIRAGYNGTGVWTVKGGTSTIKSNVVLVLKGDYKTFTVNFDKDATLDVKKSVYGLDGYTGTAVTFKGTGDGPGNILIRGESGTIHNLGNITFNNMNGSIASAITGTSAVTKSGAGTVTLSGANTYTGATTVSGGKLVLASSGSLASNVTISGGEFVDGANSITSKVTVNGGTFSIGETSATSRITIGDFALTSGTVNFDFNSASTANDFDFLTTGAATLTSGSVNVLFNNGDETTWWDNVSDSGYVLISSTAMTADLTNVALLINNNAGTENWYLDQTDNALVLKKLGGVGPTPGDDTWYYANTNDINEPSWTIDGTNKLGVKFKEGGASATYAGGVAMNSNGEFEIGSGRSLTVSNVISGEGALTKTGDGTLELSGDNTFTGGTNISQGTLKVSNVNGLGTGLVTLNGGTLDTTGSAMAFANSIKVDENGGTITVQDGGDYTSFSSISGSGDLSTNGRVEFRGSGGYNGHLTVASGYARVTPGAFGVFDLTLDNSNFAGANSSGTIQIGKLNSPIGNKYIFGSNADFDYVFEIGVGTSSTDESTFGYAIRGSANGAHNVTIKKVGDGTQIFNRNGYGFMYNNHEYAMDSLKEVIVDGGKMIIDATSGNSEFAYNKAVGYWGTAPITVNSGATLEFKQPWTVAPNSDMTINGGTLTLDNTQYINKLTLNSGTINGAGNVQAGYHGNADWNVKGGVTTINNNVVLVKNDSSTTFTINFDKDATLNIVKDVYSHSTLSGMELIFKGTGDGPGTINLTSTAAMTKVGNVTFNNMNGTIASAITGESAVAKTGAGTVTLTGANDYTGATTVSGGTLVLASSGTLASNVTVGSGATFVDGASSITSNVTINGGTFTIGDTSAASRIAIGDFALTSGTVNFDFNSASAADNYDFLTTGAATLTSGTINVTFNSGDVDTWWSNCSDSGYALISASSLTPGNIQLLVNSAQSQQWYLDTTGNTLVLKKQGSEPPTDKYYRANSPEALAEDAWTIDGTNKEGVKFTEGDKTTETYTGGVEMNVSGSVEVAENKNLTLSGVVSGEGAMDKIGEGTLTLSGDNTYSGDTTVSEGKLTLSGAAVKANGPIDIVADATLEYNVPRDEKSLEFTNSNAVTGSNAIKTGAGTLKILSTDGQFAPENFTVEAGKLDFKGKYNGDLIVKTGSTLSPGNSVGDLTVYGNVIIETGATGLFEFSAYNEDPALQQFDTLAIDGAGAFVIDENSIIKLYFENNDADLWATEGAEYQLVSDADFNVNVMPTLGNYQGWFDLIGKGDGLYLVGLGAPESTGVPEPSTWALLALGVIVLFLRKRVRN